MNKEVTKKESELQRLLAAHNSTLLELNSTKKDNSTFENMLKTNCLQANATDALDARYMEKLSGKDSIICELTRTIQQLDKRLSSVSDEKASTIQAMASNIQSLESRMSELYEKNKQLEEEVRVRNRKDQELSVSLAKAREECNRLQDDLDKSLLDRAELDRKHRQEKSQLVSALSALSEKHSELLTALENTKHKSSSKSSDKANYTAPVNFHGPILKDPIGKVRAAVEGTKSSFTIQNRLQTISANTPAKNLAKRLRKS